MTAQIDRSTTLASTPSIGAVGSTARAACRYHYPKATPRPNACACRCAPRGSHDLQSPRRGCSGTALANTYPRCLRRSRVKRRRPRRRARGARPGRARGLATEFRGRRVGDAKFGKANASTPPPPPARPLLYQHQPSGSAGTAKDGSTPALPPSHSRRAIPVGLDLLL